jgi:hypothetical protein
VSSFVGPSRSKSSLVFLSLALRARESSPPALWARTSSPPKGSDFLVGEPKARTFWSASQRLGLFGRRAKGSDFFARSKSSLVLASLGPSLSLLSGRTGGRRFGKHIRVVVRCAAEKPDSSTQTADETLRPKARRRARRRVSYRSPTTIEQSTPKPKTRPVPSDLSTVGATTDPILAPCTDRNRHAYWPPRSTHVFEAHTVRVSTLVVHSSPVPKRQVRAGGGGLPETVQRLSSRLSLRPKASLRSTSKVLNTDYRNRGPFDRTLDAKVKCYRFAQTRQPVGGPADSRRRGLSQQDVDMTVQRSACLAGRPVRTGVHDQSFRAIRTFA